MNYRIEVLSQRQAAQWKMLACEIGDDIVFATEEETKAYLMDHWTMYETRVVKTDNPVNYEFRKGHGLHRKGHH